MNANKKNPILILFLIPLFIFILSVYPYYADKGIEQPQTGTPEEESHYADIAAASFKPNTDIALTGIRDWSTLPLAFSNGNGTFIVTNFTIGNFAGWSATTNVKVLTGDFNGDELSDIALTGGSTWNTLPVAFSNCDGTFTVTNQPIGNFAGWAATVNVKVLTGDFNGDGKTDIALTGVSTWNTLPVAFSNGNGTFKVTNQPIGDFAGWAANANAKVLTGDFNGDGKTDIALTGESTWNALPIAFSKGDGTFCVTNKPIIDFAGWTTTENVKILTGDFNGDCLTDIALAGGIGWCSVPVAFSNGDGTFIVTSEPIGDFAVWAAVANVKILTGDFNGDGLTDIALTGGNGWICVPVAFSNGDGTFSVTCYPIGDFACWATTANVKILTGDFNGDGKTDIALTGGKNWTTIPTAFSNGNGTFTVTNKSIANFGGWASTADVKALTGDINGDGRTDISLTGASGWGTLPTAFSNGDGTYTVTNKPISNFAGWAANANAKVLTGDFNGDGKTDIALTGESTWNTLPVAFSNGDGTFDVTNKPIGDFASWASNANAKILTGDFNRDGKTDIALTGGSTWNALPVAFSNGDGTFCVTNKPISNFACWAASTNVRVLPGDFNGDGKTDIALTGNNKWGSVPVAFSKGDGSFNVTNKSIANFAGWAATENVKVLTGDFNSDGRTDIALTGVSTWSTLPVAFSIGDGSFSVTNQAVSGFASLSVNTNVNVLVGDFNGDGKTDIALTGSSKWSNLPVAFSNGNGTFNVTNKPIDSFAVWAAVANVKILVGDFNSDRKADIALTGGSGWGSIPVAFSNGNGTFNVTNKAIRGFASWAATANVKVLTGNFN
ncbi:MAG: FG-GAP repeat domain-containing protein [Candidatus Omnitrophota bacterium]